MVLSINNQMINNRLTLLKGNQKLQAYEHPDEIEFYFHLYDLCEKGRHFFKAEPDKRILKHFKKWENIRQELEEVLESDVEIDYLSLGHQGKLLLKVKGFTVQLKEQSKEQTEQRAKREEEMIEGLKKKQAQKTKKERPQTKQIQPQQYKDTPAPKKENIENHGIYDFQNRWKPAKKYSQFSLQSAVFQLRAKFSGKDKPIYSYGTGAAITYHSIFTCAHNIYADPQDTGKRIKCEYVEILRNNKVIARLTWQNIQINIPDQYMDQTNQNFRRHDFALLLCEQIPCAFHPFKLLKDFEGAMIARIIGYPLLDKGSTSFQGKLWATRLKDDRENKYNGRTQIEAQCDITVLREKDIVTKGNIKGVIMRGDNKKQFPFEGMIRLINPKRCKAEKQGQSQFDIEGQIILQQYNEKEKRIWKIEGTLIGHQFPSKLNAMKYEISDGKGWRNKNYNQDFYRLKNAQNWINLQGEFLWHKISSSKGQSGSPLIIQQQKGYQFMIGIHIADNKQEQFNMGIPLCSMVVEKIYQWELQFFARNPDHKYHDENCELKVFDYAKSQHISQVQCQPGFSLLIDPIIKKKISQIEKYCQKRQFIKAFEIFRKVKLQSKQGYINDDIQQLLVIALEKIIKGFCQFKHLADMSQESRTDQRTKRNLDHIIRNTLEYFASVAQKPFFYVNMQFFQLKTKIMKEMFLHEYHGELETKKETFEQWLVEIDKVQNLTKNRYTPEQVNASKAARSYKVLRFECMMRLALWYAAHLKMDLALESYFAACKLLDFGSLVLKYKERTLLLYRQMFQKYYLRLKSIQNKQMETNSQFRYRIESLIMYLEEQRMKGQLDDSEYELNKKLDIIYIKIQQKFDVQFALEILDIVRKHYKVRNFKVNDWAKKIKDKEKSIK